MLINLINTLSKNRRYSILCFLGITLAVVVIVYKVLISSQTTIIEHEALRVAAVVTDQAVTSRDVFSTVVADKLKKDGFGITEDFQIHKGFVPIPAQFMKLTASEARIRSSGLYRYRILSKWNIEPSQGLRDDFELWAWKELEKQDLASPTSAIKWQPVWRIETKEGQRILRYMRADPASDNGCLTCHNAYEKRSDTSIIRKTAGVALGKQWKLHQLLGAVQAEIPLGKIESIASQQARIALVVVLITCFSGLSLIAMIAWQNLKQEEATSLFFKKKAHIDALTGLCNRTSFEAHVGAAISVAKSKDTKLGILFIDLDGFKPINDNFGHQAGDWLLQQVSTRFLNTLRDIDVIARQGGDEFLVLLQGVTDTQKFNIVAEKLIDSLKPEFEIEGKKVQISASIGISHFPQHGTDLGTLITRADAAMYVAKKSGKNTWREWGAKPNGV